MAAGAGDKTPSFIIPITSGPSNILDLTGYSCVAMQTPAAWTSALPIVIQCSVNGVVWGDLYDDEGNQGSLAANASRFIPLNPAYLQNWKYVRIKSDGQAAARTVTVILRPLAMLLK
jgi:hypothetical protein